MHARLLHLIQAQAVLELAARPRRFSRLLLSRTPVGGSYGLHVDNALMGPPGERLRTDLAFTLFLSDPADYAGGALAIHRSDGVQRVRLPAGDMVLYPAGALHEVEPVTAGERLVCVGWIESFVPDPEARELLFELDSARAALAGQLAADAPELLALDRVAVGLLRRFVVT